ncbi:MAG: hypothetical protein ACPLXP_01040 [Microgenomates group bacterium]
MAGFGFLVYFFLLGLISILGQAVILREITSLFYGNEIFYGLGLGSWLLFVGLGSFLGTKIKFLKNKTKILWLILAIDLVLIPVLVIFLPWLVRRFIPFGELPNFYFAFLSLGIVLFPLCFSLGALFALGAIKKDVNLAYFWETIGFAAGGLLFSFFLATINFPPGVINSKYQQIVITEKEGQKNYFLDGQLAFTNKESFENKQLVSLIAPFLRNPKKILLVTSPGLANEIQKIFLPEKIFFLEIDQKLLEAERELLTEKISPLAVDSRKFLTEDNNQWDLIVFSPGNPQSLLGNRYFTLECFDQVKKRLNEKGIFVLIFYLPTDYQSEEAARFGGSVYQTLKNVFPFLELLTPEDQLLFLASKSKIEVNPANIAPRFSDYFWYQFKNPQREKITQRLKTTAVKINSDFSPAAFFYSQLFWQTIFNFRLPKLISKMVFIFPFFLIGGLGFLLSKTKRNLRLGVLAASSSFILLSLEILLVFLFQIKIGYLYSQISLIFASVLLGIGIGVIKKINTRFLGYLPILGALFLLGRNPIFWFSTAFFLGVIGGGIFATINNIYFKKNKNPGYIYAFDLFGGVFGAFLTSSLLLPAFGLKGLLIFLASVILISFLGITSKLRE